MPTKPTITVYDEKGKVVQRLSGAAFKESFWCDLAVDPKEKEAYLLPHHWRSRGLAGQAVCRVDEKAENAYVLQIANGKVASHPFSARSDLRCYHPDGKTVVFADADAAVSRGHFDTIWQTDLNTAIPKSPKPWVANARATPIVPGVWQLPGGRVESDLGGQRVIEAPDGLILIEGHAGLSFEREWAAMVAVGLDPTKVKYVLATHEHGDHAPGAYLWRVVTEAKFVCSEEMAYTLQHHIPGNTGYGLHPPVPTDIRIKRDETLDLAGLKVKAIRIPGHTAGSMAWHFEKSGKTFVAFGDLIMPRGVLGYSGSVNFSAADALASLRKLHDLKVDYVLPGHGAVEGPDNYFKAGIDVGSRVGWGFIKPERPDPRFRITKDNVVVVGWGQGATSAAFGDVNGDGKPDVVIVCPAPPLAGRASDGERGPLLARPANGDGGSVVKIFLNHGGKFNGKPDHEIKVPTVHQPHKIRVVHGTNMLVAGKTAALLLLRPRKGLGRPGSADVIPFDLADGNQLGVLDGYWAIVSRRFGGTFVAEPGKDEKKLATRRFVPDIDGPYVDFRLIGNDLLTSYGKLYRKDKDGKFGKAPLLQLPREKDWQFLGVGDFNGDGKPDAAMLSYGMDRATHARLFYGTGNADRPFKDKEDAVIGLSKLLASTKKKQSFPLVRDTPVVADWNGDGIDDLVVAHGQSDEVLIFLGGKDGLSEKRVVHIPLEYRVHYEHGVYVGDFNGDGKMDLAVFGYTNTGVGAGGPPAAYLWLQ